VTEGKEFVIRQAMAEKNPGERQNVSGYRLSDAQAEEIARIQVEIRDGKATFATDEQMAELWKSCGL
jgi:hypothetical protein